MDLLYPPSPQASLQSIAVISDDLIYFTNPNASSSSPPTPTLIEESVQMLESNATQVNHVLELPQFQEPTSNDEPKVSQKAQGTESHASAVSEMFSEPYLLGMVLREQLGDNRGIHNKTYLLRELLGDQLVVDNRCIHDLLATAVHAILLDSGFVLFDPVSGLQIDRFRLPDEWPSSSSFCYSLPQLFTGDDGQSGPRFTDYVVLKFQTLTHFFQVYGSLAKSGSGLYRLSLDEHSFAPTLEFLWAHCLKNSTVNNYNDGSIDSTIKREIFKFWKIVKDGLASPLLIDFCESTGLSLPACLISLPPILKLKILESLPGIDIARTACVCSEMRSVASDNDLWKRKVEKEFGVQVGGSGNWKKMFRCCWGSRKKRKREVIDHVVGRLVGRPFRNPVTLTTALNPTGGVFVGSYDDGYNIRFQYLRNAE